MEKSPNTTSILKTAKSFTHRTHGKVEIKDFSYFSLNLSLTPPLLAPFFPLCKTPSKLSNDVLSFTWLVLDYLPGSPCRPIKHPWSHGHCLASSAFIMVINSGTKNEWWNNPIQKDLKMPFTKGPYIDSRQFHISFARSGLIEYERTGRRELLCGSFTFHPHRERMWYLSSLCNPPHVSHIALGGSIVRDNMFLKAFLFTWPDNRIFYSV